MLSGAGTELIPVMEAMCGWGTKHLGVAPNLVRTASKPA
jgi:DNA-binding HxlR family transcriptional regulator